MERKIQYVIVSLLCSFFFTPAVLADDRLNAPLLIRVGAYENKPKIFTDESGNVVGLFADILNHISKEEGWQLEYVHGSWSQCLKRLEENEIDLMVDVAYSEKRAQKYHFTNVTVLINWAIVYAGTNQKIESLIDLNGKRIAVMKASIHTEGVEGIKSLAKNFDINCRFVEVESYQEVFERISNGEVEAGVVNRIYGSLFSKAYNVRQTSPLDICSNTSW